MNAMLCQYVYISNFSNWVSNEHKNRVIFSREKCSNFRLIVADRQQPLLSSSNVVFYASTCSFTYMSSSTSSKIKSIIIVVAINIDIFITEIGSDFCGFVNLLYFIFVFIFCGTLDMILIKVRVLFELARHHAPSTIFLDELDSIMSMRSNGGGTSDHEGSRRMKTELLMQMDGLNRSDDLVFVLGASNLPWELDPAMLRRLEKRILVDLPILVRMKLFLTI